MPFGVDVRLEMMRVPVGAEGVVIPTASIGGVALVEGRVVDFVRLNFVGKDSVGKTFVRLSVSAGGFFSERKIRGLESLNLRLG